MGLQIKIPNLSFTDLTLPTLYVEPMLTNGSLFLIDPTHPYNVYTGNLNNTQIMPNIAEPQALALVAGNTGANIYNPNMAVPNINVERTAKGGIHAIISQTAVVSTVFDINLPDNIRDYMLTNINTHSFYTSLWHMVTRAEVASVRRNFGGYTHNDANYLWVFDAQGDLPAVASTQRIGAHQTAPGTANGPIYRSIGVNGPTNGYGTINTPDGKSIFGVGNNSGWYAGAGNTGASPSHIFYRAYIEDLTVSGRTYAQVDAIDYALYQKEIMNVGGRYYGDTFTDPVTLP